MSAETVIKISGDSKGFEKAAQEAQKELKGLSQTVTKETSVSKLAFSNFLGTMSAQAVSKAFSVVTDGFRAFSALVQQSVKDAQVQEDAINEMNQSLVRTGQYTKAASQQMQDFASDLQKNSRYGDEAILHLMGAMQDLGRLTTTELKRATQATADFAESQNIDLTTAGKIISKVAAGQVSALSRYGIELKSTGDKTQDFNNAIAALESRFSGAAKGALATFSSQQQQMKNDIGDAREELGFLVTKSPAMIAAIGGVGEVFRNLGSYIKENRAELNNYITQGIFAFINGLGLAADGVKLFISTKSLLQDYFNGLSVALTETGSLGANINATIAESSAAAIKFFGGSASSLEQFAASSRESAKVWREITIENVTANNERAKSDEELKAKIESVTGSIQETLRARVIEVQNMNQEEIDAELEKQSQLNAIRIANEEANDGKDTERLEYQKLASEENLAYIQSILGQEEALRSQARVKELVAQGGFNAATKQLNADLLKARKADIFTYQKFEELGQKERVANMQSTLGQISSLQSSSSKEMFMIGKAAAIGTATIDGFAAVQKALASAPPPFNFALAAIVGAVTAGNIANIASQKPPTGAVNGAFVDKGIYGKDTEPFMLSKGEIVAPAKDFDDVVEGVARQRGFEKRGDKQEQSSQSTQESIVVQIQGDFYGEETFIDRLAEKLLEAQRTRNLRLV